MTTVVKAFLRYLPRRRALSALQLLGIAFGVASAIGMTLSARAALSSFTRAVEFLGGKATHALTRPAGPLDERILTRLMADPDVTAFSPVLDRRLELDSGETVRILGVDPFLDRAFRPGLAPPEGDLLAFVLGPDTVLASEERGASPVVEGDAQILATWRGPLRVIGTFPNPSGEPILLMDIGHLQDFFGLRGLVDRVDLILKDAEGFRARWGEGFLVRSGAQNRATLGEMLRAFRLNLEALSLLGLFVGVFLVYNTAMFAVVSRRRDAGILFSLGARRLEVASAFLGELLLLGGLGGVLGALLGYGLSRFFTGLLGGAISNLYFFLRPTPPAWSWGTAGVGAVLGWGASLLGGAYPLLELVHTRPVEALRGRVHTRSSRARARRAALAGVGVAAVSFALFPPATHYVYAGFAGAFGLLVAASLACGVALEALGPVLARTCRWVAGLPGKVAAGNIPRNLGRTAVAVAAFTVALSMAVGLGLMIGSFRQTLLWWMGTQLTGDLYVAPGSEAEVPRALYEELLGVEGVAGIDAYRNVQVLYGETPIYVSAVRANVLERFADFAWMEGGDESWEAVERGSVIVSESFSRRFGKGRGDDVTLEGVTGPRTLPIAGVFYDYTTEHGLVMMDWSTYESVYADRTLNSLGVFLEPGAPAEVEQTVRQLASRWNLAVLSRAELHEGILEVFDATFAVTRSMRVLAVVVAFFGITGALLTLYMERQREFGIYRALGFSTPQVATMTLMEGVGMGLASFLFSILLGAVLAWVLIRVINLQSFHWTIFLHPAPAPFLTAGVIALLASVGAAAYPIWRVWRTFPQMQIREE